MKANVSRLKVARVTAGMTQFELAQRLNLPEVTISRLETGRQLPTQELRDRISAVLGKSGIELFGGVR